MNQKGFVNIFLIILVVAVIGVTGYFVLGKNSSKTATVSVTLSPSTGNFKRGANIVTSWQSTNTPRGSFVYLQLIPPQGRGDSESIIADGLSVNGSYEWDIPSSSDRVAIGGDYTLHGVDIVDGKTYQIRAALYIPTSAQCFEGCPPSLGTQLTHADSVSFTIEPLVTPSPTPKPATNPSKVFSANPTVGRAPLNVNFTVSAIDSGEGNGIYYTIVFGDGEAAGFSRTSAPTLSHVYSVPGTYTATVTRRTQCSSWECLGPSAIIGTSKITVQ